MSTFFKISIGFSTVFDLIRPSGERIFTSRFVQQAGTVEYARSFHSTYSSSNWSRVISCSVSFIHYYFYMVLWISRELSFYNIHVDDANVHIGHGSWATRFIKDFLKWLIHSAAAGTAYKHLFIYLFKFNTRLVVRSELIRIRQVSSLGVLCSSMELSRASSHPTDLVALFK